jgi:hypothetical protein
MMRPMESSRPHADLLAVPDPAVDVVALQAEIARAAAGHRTVAVRAMPAEARRRQPLGRTAEVSPHPALDARFRAVVAVERTVRRALRWYLWPVTAQTSSHNRAVAEVVEAQRRELARLRIEAERLDHDLALLGGGPE